MEKQAELSTGGYDYQFVETPPDMLICKICHFPSREPRLSECCGHTFCKSCIDYAKKATGFYQRLICPVCRDEDFTSFHNKQNERAIKSLYVFCSNKERGCKWQGELNNISDHLKSSDGCPFEEAACSNNCENVLQRKFLNDHLVNECPRRKVDCQYCHIIDEFRYIEGDHIEKCPKYPLPCPNNCGIFDIPREDVDNHQKICPLEEMDCPNKCRGSFQRQCLQSHVENECPCREVTCQYCQTVGKQQFIEDQHKELCPKFPLICPNYCEAENILRENMETHKKECPLEMVQCEYHCVGCMTIMVRKETQKHNQEKMEEHLSFTMSELVSTRDKLKTTEKQLAVNEQALNESKQQLAINTDEALSKLQKKIEAIEYQSQLKLQQVMGNMRWIIQLNSRASKNTDQVFPAIIKMSEFKSRKDFMEDWYSHTFFTHKRRLFLRQEMGYRIKLNVVPNGYDDGAGTHLSVYLYMEEGPNDTFLTWPMRKKLKVKLLNQVNDSQHHSEMHLISAKKGATQSGRCIWYAHRFISHDLLYSPTADCKYLDNDCIFFEVSEEL